MKECLATFSIFQFIYPAVVGTITLLKRQEVLDEKIEIDFPAMDRREKAAAVFNRP